MPLILFPELTSQLWRTGRTLAPWSRLVGIEQTLLRRVESAYLTAWFGPRVPERQLSLHIAIRNIAALRDRYQLANRSRPEPISGISLLGPLAGIAGALVGAAISPTGMILIVTQFTRIGAAIAPLWNIVTVLGAIVIALPSTGLPLGVIAGLGLPLGLFAALGYGIAGDAAARSVVTLLGNLGLMIDAMGRFWDQLTGPREAVKNPLLRRILETLDRFAGLFIQMIGMAAFLFDRLLPLVPGLITQFRALSALADTVLAAIKDVLSGIVDALFAPFDQKPGRISSGFGARAAPKAGASTFHKGVDCGCVREHPHLFDRWIRPSTGRWEKRVRRAEGRVPRFCSEFPAPYRPDDPAADRIEYREGRAVSVRYSCPHPGCCQPYGRHCRAEYVRYPVDESGSVRRSRTVPHRRYCRAASRRGADHRAEGRRDPDPR